MIATLLKDSAFWVDVAFFIFLGLVFWRGYKPLRAMLDSKIAEISKEIDHARILKEQAQQVLAEMRKREEGAGAETEKIIQQAESNIAFIHESRKKALEKQLILKEKNMERRIENAYIENRAHLRQITVDIAIKAATQILQEELEGKIGDELIKKATGELPAHLRNIS